MNLSDRRVPGMPDGPLPIDKLSKLWQVLGEMNSVLVAFSAGVDSTFLLWAASQVLGPARVAAATGDSETYPDGELAEAGRLAASLGVRHLVLRTCELANPVFAANPPDRCYHCKTELFTRLWTLAREHGLEQVVDGSNLDDEGDFRPGLKAAGELGVRSPLREAGLTKGEIREMSRAASLSTWDKPSMACLSSRFPYGMEITPERLAQVSAAEKVLDGLGFRGFRVRHHGSLARIEVPAAAFPEALEKAGLIVEGLKQAGFTYVTLDLEGYRSGSMNAVLGKAPSPAWRTGLPEF